MTSKGWFSGILKQQPSFAMYLGMIVAIFLAVACIVAAQGQSTPAPAPESTMSIPSGYTAHHSIDMGGRMSDISGSGEMYDTLVNLHAGPRVQAETFGLHALPGNKHTLVDDLSAFGTGFGGDPNIMAKLDFSKAKFYEFSGMFRRDRLYSDYDLLGNPNIPSGYSINNMVERHRHPSAGLAAGEQVAGDVQHRAPHDRHQPHVDAARPPSPPGLATRIAPWKGPRSALRTRS